ncbi:YjzD family protein [Staphylococcus canis]|uniref:YjzD family protein n=1 Tax=Staphylococcus canis TaxID=2724942 RepID=A0ABS0T9Q6_9STAP|nr:YjzD family protein [Staphylococcus canis]MBI5975290.1 YjzD family protein [Staphylococcus canis]
MKYIVTLFWAVLLLEMVNFVLNSLGGGGPVDVITPLIVAVIATIIVILLDKAMTPSKYETHHSE